MEDVDAGVDDPDDDVAALVARRPVPDRWRAWICGTLPSRSGLSGWSGVSRFHAGRPRQALGVAERHLADDDRADARGDLDAERGEGRIVEIGRYVGADRPSGDRLALGGGASVLLRDALRLAPFQQLDLQNGVKVSHCSRPRHPPQERWTELISRGALG